MRAIAIAATLVAAAVPTLGYDLRELWNHTASADNGIEFCKSWKCACINLTPSDSSLYFRAAYCRPGDYKGQNNQTQALAYCSFTSDGTTPVIESADVAALVGAVHA